MCILYSFSITIIRDSPFSLSLFTISKVKNGKSFDRLDLVVKINFSNMFLWSKRVVIDTNFTFLDSAHAFFFLSMSFGVASTSIRMLCLPFLLGASLVIIYFPLKRKSKKKKLNMCWILYICGLREFYVSFLDFVDEWTIVYTRFCDNLEVSSLYPWCDFGLCLFFFCLFFGLLCSSVIFFMPAQKMHI